MGVTHEIAPALRVARIFFMLPFSSLDHSRPTLRSPLVLRLFTLAVHLTFLSAYLFNAWLTLENFKTAAKNKSIKDSSAYATLFILQCVDIVNTFFVMTLSYKTCNLLQNTLKNLVTIERKLFKCKRSTWPLFLSIYTLTLYIFKVIMSLNFLRKKKLTVTIMIPTIASATMIASEQLIFLICCTIYKHLRCINENLVSAASTGHIKIARLTRAFELLSRIQDDLNIVFGPFLLLNLSQLFLNALYIPIKMISSCLYELTNICPIITWISTFSLMTTYLLRFLLVIGGCSIVPKEAERTAIFASRLLRRGMDSDTALEMETLRELSLSRRLNFSACGLFTVDIPLLFAAGGAITSYLLLITQLK